MHKRTSVSEQINGLSGVGKLCRDCGMLFVFGKPKIQSFWMYGMKFPLDFVFIRDSRVVEVVENVQVNDDSGNIHQIIGKSNFESKQLLENFKAFYDAVVHAKPSTVKGQYIVSVSMNATMGPGIKLKV